MALSGLLKQRDGALAGPASGAATEAHLALEAEVNGNGSVFVEHGGKLEA